LKRQLLDKIAAKSASVRKDSASEQLIPKDEDDDDSIDISDVEDDAGGDDDLKKLGVYEDLEEKSRDIPLQKMIFSPEGIALFDELCLRIDVNQRYVSVLPQWTDLAHLLEVDSLRTKWVETCVRPREGLTRAMLEIYMNDGGTLGEVLGALIKLECFDILETVRAKAERFIELHNMGSSFDPSAPGGGTGNEKVNEKFFSVIKTLMTYLGNGDPCDELQKFKFGLKYSMGGGGGLGSSGKLEAACPTGPVTQTIQHVGLVQNSGSAGKPNLATPQALFNDDSKVSQFRSDLHLDELKAKRLAESGDLRHKCKILLLFSKDGVEAADQFVDIAKSVQHPDVVTDVFRLNEVSLWYEVLTNPEACCMKWSTEADYIMPVLTPMFLQEIHCNFGDNDDDGFMPTSPMLNRYMYQLARTQYTQAGSKNMKVRPVIPLPVLRQIRMSNAVKIDPLLNSSWVPLNEERVTRRIDGMLKEWVRRKNVANGASDFI